MREQGGMEMGVEEREEWSSETCVYRPDDQTPRSSSTAPVPQLSIWNSRMRIFMYAEVLFQRQRGWEKLISLCGSPKSRDGAAGKAQTAIKIKLSRRTPCCQTKKNEMQMVFDQTEAFGRNILQMWSDLWPRHRGGSSGALFPPQNFT